MRSPLHPDDPTHMGEYTLIGRLGEGGMGTVFLGRNPEGRQVAIKVIRSEYARDDRFRRRFRSEVNRARQVPPFCTAEVLDADPDHTPPYLVVEYIDGPNLTDVVLEHGPLALANLHSVAVGTATALTAIHGAGVIHRDLKPGNVLFTLGGIKVIDFGIARALEATSHHTRTDHMVGTIAYMAPERFEPESTTLISPAADIFSWGAVVAYAATGHTPFSADSAPGTVMRILTQPPDLTGLPDPVRDLVHSALAKQPHDRPTARELLDRLLAAAPSPSPMARQHEVPFLREVMRSAEHAAPARPTNTRPPAGRSSVARPATDPPYAIRSGGARSSTAGSAKPRSGAPAGPAAVSAPPAQSPKPASRPIVVRTRPAGRALRRRTLLDRIRPGRATPTGGPPGGAGPPGRWPLRRWLTQGSVAATVLIILVAGSLAYRALGNDGGDADETAGPKVLNTPATSSVPADPDGVEAILNGERRTLLHVREIDKDLSLATNGAAIVAADDRQRTEFTLVPSGTAYLIRTHEQIGGARPCLIVKRATRFEALAAGSCAESDATLFDLTATGATDGLNRPTYYLRNAHYGIVQWSSDRSQIFVDEIDPALVDTTFVLIDQGPA